MTSTRVIFGHLNRQFSANLIPKNAVRMTINRCFTAASNAKQIPITERFISLDVECVSTGKNRDDRAICSVGIVDENCEILFNKIVKPSVPVTDYLTPITGFTEDSLINGEKEEEVLQEIHSILSENVVLVGQSPENDIKWLKLKEGIHFKRVIDLCEMTTTTTATGRPLRFSLDHQVRTLLLTETERNNLEQSHHVAVEDAKNAMTLYKKYSSSSEQWMNGAKHLLRTNRPLPKLIYSRPVSAFPMDKVVVDSVESMTNLLDSR